MKKTVRSSTVGLDDARKIAITRICRAYGRTGIGGRSENQDLSGGGRLGNCTVLTVCDGMGGMNGGRLASDIAVKEILNTIIAQPISEWGKDLIIEAVNNANQAIYRKSANEPRLRGMGTTATVLMITPEAAYLTHVGDSRIYQLRNGKKIFRTFDHSKVFEMVANNMMTEEQARNSSFSNVITRALGIRPSVGMEIQKLPYKRGDRFVLCSDGIWNCLPEPEMIELFNKKPTPLSEVTFLAEKVNGIGFEQGEGHDNLTVIVADIDADSKFQYSIFRPLKKAWSNMVSRRKKTSKNQRKTRT